MAIPKVTTRPQVSLDNGVYGSLPPEGMPLPEDTADAQILYWYQSQAAAGQWVHATIVAGAGMDLDFDPDTGILSITNRDYRVYFTFTADALLQDTLEGSFTANAVLV